MQPIVMKSSLIGLTNEGAEYMTRAEAAEYLRISPAHISNLVRGKVAGALVLRCGWIGRRMVFKRTWLNEFMEAIAELNKEQKW